MHEEDTLWISKDSAIEYQHGMILSEFQNIKRFLLLLVAIP